MFRALIALLQFTTILPLGKTVPFEIFARNTWLYPITGYVTGGIGLLILLCLPAPPLVASLVAIGVILLITGCNHLDGLFDLGDGLMAHGSQEKRRHALCDRTIGTGGIALGLFIILLSVFSLNSLPYAAYWLLLSEVCGKWTMSCLTSYGKPFHDGIHAILHGHSRWWFPGISALLVIPVFLLPLPEHAKGLALCVMVIIPVFLNSLSNRFFGGVNGDVVGACGEITRATILAVLACAL